MRHWMPIFILALAFAGGCGDDGEDTQGDTGADTSAAADTGIGADTANDTATASDTASDTADASATEDTTSGSDTAGDAEPAESNWGEVCASSDSCTGVTDYCVIQPTETEGYCATTCATTTGCAEVGAPEGWTCNTVEFLGCDDVATNWCAPPEELVENAAFLIECTE